MSCFVSLSYLPVVLALTAWLFIVCWMSTVIAVESVRYSNKTPLHIRRMCGWAWNFRMSDNSNPSGLQLIFFLNKCISHVLPPHNAVFCILLWSLLDVVVAWCRKLCFKVAGSLVSRELCQSLFCNRSILCFSEQTPVGGGGSRQQPVGGSQSEDSRRGRRDLASTAKWRILFSTHLCAFETEQVSQILSSETLVLASYQSQLFLQCCKTVLVDTPV